MTPDVACTYPAGSFGELDGNLTGLLATEKADTTPFSMEDDTAPEIYVTGDPSPLTPAVRNLERDVAGLTAANPYSGNANETLANYLADPTEEAILHMVNADPGPHADVRPFRQARLLPLRRRNELLRCLCRCRHRLCVGPRRLRRRDQQQLGRFCRSRGRRISGSTAPRRSKVRVLPAPTAGRKLRCRTTTQGLGSTRPISSRR